MSSKEKISSSEKALQFLKDNKIVYEPDKNDKIKCPVKRCKKSYKLSSICHHLRNDHESYFSDKIYKSSIEKDTYIKQIEGELKALKDNIEPKSESETESEPESESESEPEPEPEPEPEIVPNLD